MGDLDASFGENGLLSLPIGSYGSAAFSGLQQSDGKLVLAGNAGHEFAVARILDNGAADAAFDGDGVATADFFGYDDTAYAVAQEPDGKLVLAGIAQKSDGTSDIALARFNVNGTLDPGFGNSGKLTVDILGNRDSARSMAMRPDGSFVVAGKTADATGAMKAILVFVNQLGRLDWDFGALGVAMFEFPGVIEPSFNGVALQADGRIVVAGSALTSDGLDILVARMTADGQLDPTFGVDGIRTIDIGGGDEEGLSVLIQPDSKIVVGGYARPTRSDKTDGILVRLAGNGDLDAGFGNSGVAKSAVSGSVSLMALALDSDGRIIATGSLLADKSTSIDTIVDRFNADGSIDTGFGNEGREIIDYGHDADAPISEGDALIRVSDGRYVVTGANSMGTFAAARLDDAAESAGRIGLTSTFKSTKESDSQVSYTVRRTGGSFGRVSVDYATSPGEAESGLDFKDAGGTLTWDDGDSGDRTVSIDIVDDSEVESNETFAFELSAPTGGAQLAGSEALTTILSDDGPGQISVLFALDELQPHESTTEISIPVQRFSGSQGAVSVRYATAGGTAKSGADFAPAEGTLTWADGESGSKSIPIRLLQDSIAEGPENFAVCLSSPTGGATIPWYGSLQMVVIIDDELPDDRGNGGFTFNCQSAGGGGNSGGGGNGSGGSGGGNDTAGGGGASGYALAWLAALALRRKRGAAVHSS